MSMIRSAYDRAPVFAQNVMLSGYGAWLRYLRAGARQHDLVAQLRAVEMKK